MSLQLFHRRTLWWPTRRGWLCLLTPPLALIISWCLWGESFLAVNQPLPAQVLVVEGWADRDSMAAAVHEFQRESYRLLVTSGGPTGDSWAVRNWNYAELAAADLLRHGIPKDQLLAAPAKEHDTQRTYQAALAVWKALESRGPLPVTITIWTRGSHARRSRLVYARVFGSQTHVGVVSWLPEESKGRSWWQSSERSREFLGETAGYFFELLFYSARWASSTPAASSP